MATLPMERMSPERFTMIRITVQGVLNFPARSLRSSAKKSMQVKVMELPPNNPESDASLPIPASFEFQNGQVEEDSVEFDPPRFFQTDLESHRSWFLDLKLCDHFGVEVAYAKIALDELARRTSWCLLMQSTSDHNPLYAGDVHTKHHSKRLTKQGIIVRRPCFLLLEVHLIGGCRRQDIYQMRSVRSFASMGSVNSLSSRAGAYVPGLGLRRRRGTRTRVFMVTRGTRGDVQPFVALARGLILQHNCEVVICTELNWKGFIKSFRAGLPDGTLRFRPCGGDTMAQTRTALSQLITWEGQHYDFLQSLIFSVQERNFFPSEGCCYFWAHEEQPDFIVFGFTMCHVAMILGEGLQIPIVGFICQPDHKIEERRDISTHLDRLLGPTRQAMNSEGFNATLMSIVQQMSMRGVGLNRLRKTRGLQSMPAGLSDSMAHFDELHRKEVPMIVPISQIALGEYKARLPQYIFTDFIFLRTEQDTLDEPISKFLAQAARAGRRVVLITFSSMPVGERTILEMAIEACTSEQLVFPAKRGSNGTSPVGVAVIAMTSGQDHDPAPPETMAQVQQLSQEGRLMVRNSGASFAALFPKLDALIGQGGLGVTSEALRAGVPIITSGILLLDQRWWAARVAELGCGSKPVKVDRLLNWDHSNDSTRLVKLLHIALDTSEEDNWTLRAKQVSAQIAHVAMHDPDGVLRNAQEVFTKGTSQSVILEDCYEENRDCCSCIARQARCCCRCIERCLRCIFFMNVPTLLYVFLLLLSEVFCCGPCRRRCRCRSKKEQMMESGEESTEDVSGDSSSDESNARLPRDSRGSLGSLHPWSPVRS
ncbi:unnamed protein product [Durusdinium trenchii]|uniref:Sterol 3-beta-glucosyltransferase (Autophagy-related protein 26) n=2 Tax=Durusdinium trenchii TaxID=1381693 RepID=A0ABP0SLS5_9DINO